MATVPTIIVGGGMAGLAAAYELHRRGRRFLLIEAGTRAGGVVLSEEVDGYTIDAGPDALLTQKPAGVALCEELGLGPRLITTKPPRLAYIQRGGRLHPLPAASVLGIPTRVGPFVRTRLFSWPGKIRMAAELFIPARGSAHAGEDDESIGAFMRRRFGVEATEYLAEPLLAGIHAGDVDRLSMRALFPRFTDAERTHGSLLKAFRRRAPGSVSVDGPFRSLPGGLSELVRALVASLPADSIRLATPVARVRREAGRLRVDTVAGESLSADAVVLATPVYVTARLLADLDAPLAALCEAIPYSSTATIVLAFRRDRIAHPLNGSGFVVPRTEHQGILAASWLSSKWPHRAPDDRVLLRTFAGGTRDPGALDRADDELVAQSIAALRPTIGIAAGAAGAPLFARVYRWIRASAQHEVGHLARLTTIDRALDGQPGLYVTGSGFRGVGIPDCIADGRATATRIADQTDRRTDPGPAPSTHR